MGSRSAFLQVDRELPAAFIRRLRELSPRPRFGLVSSVSAFPSLLFNFRVKAEVERMLAESGLRPYLPGFVAPWKQ
ncbi:MAG: hypothetical protein HY303_18545 [Candidatus Wallbacteria bacterium]|nr:hypothetical protein [Candidatus Wallbacteria bacterium]